MLKNKKCKPCEGGIDPLTDEQIKILMKELKHGWKIKDGAKITQVFKFVNFVHAMDFANKVTAIAEEENHHPLLHIGYGECTIDIWTHAIDGLSENDFILASKIDEI